MSKVARAAWGALSEASSQLQSFRLSNGRVSVTLINYGATVVSIKVPSKASAEAEEVTLCYDKLADLQARSPYYGSTVGRVANRIAGGRFSVDGTAYTVAVNNGPNHLHGGLKAFDKQFWAARPYEHAESGTAGVEFSYASAAGEEGYPGAVDARADYSLTSADELIMTFTATTSAATPINLCNHTYYNLSGALRRDIKDHVLRLAATHYLPVDASSVPTGAVAPVAGTPFDFTAPKRIGAELLSVAGDEPGYDHCLCRAGPGAVPPAGLGLGFLAELSDPVSGRKMSVSTTAPGVQLYTGNYLSKSAADAPHTQHSAVCLETQNYPNAVNTAGFPSAILRPGETYKHVAIHKFEW